MAASGYKVLKEHFDRLIFGSNWPTIYRGGLEPIRDTYTKSFGMQINMFDVYQTNLASSNNPISRIVTLVGPEESDKGLPTGIMASEGEIVSTNILYDDIFKGLDREDAESYIGNIYNAMQNIVIMDRFYKNDELARSNPYMAYVKCCPFYFTFHHIRDSQPRLLVDKVFKDLLEKYIAVDEDADKILESIASNKYTTDPETIYGIMSCKGSVPLFL